MEIVTWVSYNTSLEIGLQHLNKLHKSGTPQGYIKSVEHYIEFHSDIFTPIVYHEVPDYGVWEKEPDYYLKLRESDEKETFEIGLEGDPDYFKVIYSKFKWNQAESIMNIARTLLVCVCLGGGSIVFQKDAETIVLTPLETMIDSVKVYT